MSERDGFDNLNNENTGTDGESAVAEEIPVAEVVGESTAAEETPVAEVVVESTPVEEIAPYNPYGGQMPPNGNQGNPYGNNPYNNQYNTPYNNQYNTPYNNQYNTPYNNQYNTPYNNQYNTPYNNQYNTPYNNQYGSQYNNNPYNGNSQYNNPYNNSNPYNNNPYNNNNQYNNNPYNNNNQYNNNQYNNTSYGNNSYGGQIPPNGSQYNNNPYNNQNNNPYNNQNNNQYGNPPYNNSSYSPYAVPPKKNKNGLIIGIVIGIVVLFSIAVFALIYRAVAVFEQDNDRIRNDRDEYQFDYDDDDWGVNRYRREKKYDYDDDDDWYDDYGYDDWYNDHDYDDWYDDYDDDSQYYVLHDDIRFDLSYSVDMDYYEYDTGNQNVDIWAEYPIIQGENVPKLDKLNDVIWDEVESFIDYFEREYEEYITEDDYYDASIMGYVTYMDEDKLSIVFDERVYSYYYADYTDVYLYCINIDMENGIVMENQNMLRIDDDFSVDFRERSDIQNGESYYVSMMSDQEITDHFNSKDIIVFYTPMGMEIGFNYDEGWITVTYSEYKQYLKVF